MHQQQATNEKLEQAKRLQQQGAAIPSEKEVTPGDSSRGDAKVIETATEQQQQRPLSSGCATHRSGLSYDLSSFVVSFVPPLGELLFPPLAAAFAFFFVPLFLAGLPASNERSHQPSNKFGICQDNCKDKRSMALCKQMFI